MLDGPFAYQVLPGENIVLVRPLPEEGVVLNGPLPSRLCPEKM